MPDPQTKVSQGPSPEHHLLDSMVVPYQRLSDAEELANAITHGLACLMAIVASAYVFATVPMATSTAIGFGVYAFSLALVFFLSTLSHVVTEPERLHRMRAWDQGAIYLLIAGTYTPGVVAFADARVRDWLLAAIWLLAGFGFISKVIVRHQVHSIDTWTYIALGWFPAIVLAPGVSLDYFLWMLAGGIAYSVGVAFLMNDKKVLHFHAVWHLLVIVAAAIHFWGIRILALPALPS
ncbi:MAG: hemolysin III family protein [Pirellulaceae bacterium]